MSHGSLVWAAALAALLWPVPAVHAQGAATTTRKVAAGPAVGSSPTTRPLAAIGPPPGDLSPAPGEHPLAPLIRWGRAGIAALQKLDDYSCKLVKRERMDGKLGGHEWLSVKMRHHPFSVYAGFLRREGPPRQEVVYIDGKNGGRMFVHADVYKLMGTVSLFPDSRRAMREGRYPLTEVGILNLIQRLVEHAENDARYGDCEVKIYHDAKIEGRPCHYVRVTHTAQRPEFTFNIARIFIDNELNVPVRYEAFTWPREPGGKPELIEEYTYLDFKFHNGFTDRDFDINNPQYRFPPDYDEPKVEFGPPPATAVAPLTPAAALASARGAMTRLDQVADYTCLFSSRELAEGKLGGYEHVLLKIRHQPHSVYAFFLGPRTPRGEEAIYVAGRNGGQVAVHPLAGEPHSVARMLPPDSPQLPLAPRTPISELDMHSALARWIALCQAEAQLPGVLVRTVPGVKIDRRAATAIEVTHPRQPDGARYYRTRCYLDDELQLPVRFEAYGWPPTPGGEPPLVEERTYRNLDINRGLADEDFDVGNPNYGFGADAGVASAAASR